MQNETIEWTRTWRENADAEQKRILLVGDSMIDGSKREVQNALPDGYSISSFATSKGVDNPYYLRELEMLCEQEDFAYCAVYFNNGIHDHGQSPETFRNNLCATLKRLHAKIPNAVWIVGQCTPVTPDRGDGNKNYIAPTTPEQAKGYPPYCARILAYNEAIRSVAAELGMFCFDAFSLLLEHPEFKTDPFHLNAEGYRFFGSSIAAQVMERIG